MKIKTLTLIILYISFEAFGQIDEPEFIDMDINTSKLILGSSILIDGINYTIERTYKSEYALIEGKGKRAIIDSELNLITEPNNLYYTFKSFGVIKIEDKKKGILNYLGEEILPAKFKQIRGLDDETVVLFNTDKSVSIFNLTTKDSTTTYCKYLNLSDSRELILVSVDCKNFRLFSFKLFKEIGDSLFTNPRQSYIVDKGLMTGALDGKGDVLIPFEYTDLKDDHNFIIGKKQSKWGIINKSNETLLPFKFDTIYPLNINLLSREISDRVYVVNLENKWGVLNGMNKKIIDVMDFVTKVDTKLLISSCIFLS